MQAQVLLLGGQGQLEKCLFFWRTIFILFLTLECGYPLVQMVGKNPILSEGAWVVRLYFNDNPICGASLLSSFWAVSAALCVDGKDPNKLSLMVGAQGPTSLSRSSVLINVKTVLIHPNYKGDGTSGNLALIKLETPIDFTNNILPIRLPSPGQDFPDGMMCTVTGYTAEKDKLLQPLTLQAANLPLINGLDCLKILRDKYLDFSPEDVICAGYNDKTEDAWQGDLGGPLACQTDGTWFLVGIGRWRIGSATPSVPAVYTEVSIYASWIRLNIGLTDTFIPDLPMDSPKV